MQVCKSASVQVWWMVNGKWQEARGKKEKKVKKKVKKSKNGKKGTKGKEKVKKDFKKS